MSFSYEGTTVLRLDSCQMRIAFGRYDGVSCLSGRGLDALIGSASTL